MVWSWSLGTGRPATVAVRAVAVPVKWDLTRDGVSTQSTFHDDRKFSVHDDTTGKELWSVRTKLPIYERLFSVADVNADSILDLCIVTHLSGGNVRRHDGQTAAQDPLKRRPQLWIQHWGNYDSDPQLECVILSDYTVHVDYLENGPHGTARRG